MVLPLSFSTMILEPICPPAKEQIEARITNCQSIDAVAAWAANPEKEEKQTMKIEEAAAILVGTLIK